MLLKTGVDISRLRPEIKGLAKTGNIGAVTL
jgi:hypothetical protein